MAAATDPAPDHGALDININATLDYDGPWDPVSGSSNVRGMPCRVERLCGVSSGLHENSEAWVRPVRLRGNTGRAGHAA